MLNRYWKSLYQACISFVPNELAPHAVKWMAHWYLASTWHWLMPVSNYSYVRYNANFQLINKLSAVHAIIRIVSSPTHCCWMGFANFNCRNGFLSMQLCRNCCRQLSIKSIVLFCHTLALRVQLVRMAEFAEYVLFVCLTRFMQL